MGTISQDAKSAIYLARARAREAKGEELIGTDAITEQIIPRMVYYVRNFLPQIMEGKDDSEIVSQLTDFLKDMKMRMDSPSLLDEITIGDIWEVRAAIFGYENVFLEVLGVDVIENYVFPRIAEILTLYLPGSFKSESMSLKEKLSEFAEYLKSHNFVRNANYSMKGTGVEFRANYCQFSAIHGSKAYLDGKTRFCPWGMIANSIAAAHFKQTSQIVNCDFTSKGSITKLEMVD